MVAPPKVTSNWTGWAVAPVTSVRVILMVSVTNSSAVLAALREPAAGSVTA